MAYDGAMSENKPKPKSGSGGGEANPDKEILKDSRERLRNCVSAYSIERTQQLDDLRFCTLDQWPADVRAAREGDPNGPRPCLTIDKVNRFIEQVNNDMRQKRPSIKIRPVDNGADVETAEVFQGVVRQIEDQSQAQVAYGKAGESAVRVGEGYFRVITEYEDDASFNQVIRIKPIPNFTTVYLGPHIMPDGSDAEYGYILESVPVSRFKKEYPGKKWRATEFEEIQDANFALNWGDEDEVLVAEYFYCDYQTVNLFYLDNGQTITEKEYWDTYEGNSERPAIVDKRLTQRKSIKWCKHTGVEVLEKQDWPGKYIPIIKVIGKESWVDGRRACWGLVRPAKDTLRLYNYQASTVAEKLALAPKAPFIMAEGQDEGHETEWQNANRVNYSRLVYKMVTADGQVAPPPQRQQPSQIEAGIMQFMQVLEADVQGSLGMYKAALGQEQPQQSGRAILALTRESDTGTFHFSDNQAISIQYCGRILVDLIPKVYDTARVLRILGEDGEVKYARLDPDQQQAVRKVPREDGGVEAIYNLGVGTYDVTVTTGPSYNTRRMEAASVFTELANSAKDPGSAAVMRYLAIRNSDVTQGDEAARMLKKLLPPGIVEEDGQQIPPQVMAQVQQMQQVLQGLAQENQELKAGVREAQMKIRADHDAKMNGLALEAKVKAEQLRQKREEAAADIALKRWIAQQELLIEKAKASGEHSLSVDDQNFAHSMAEVDQRIEAMATVREQDREERDMAHQHDMDERQQEHQRVMAERQAESKSEKSKE